MRLVNLAYLVVFVTGTIAPGSAIARAARVGGFVEGRTTVADVEQGLGAPADTTMQPDGALTLVYPAGRLSGVPGTDASARTVSLHFSADFILRDTTVTYAKLEAHDGFAFK